MAKRLPHAQWDKLASRSFMGIAVHAWDEWLDGSTWLLLEGEDYRMPTHVFQNYVLVYARKHDIDVKTKTLATKDGLYVKAGPRTTRNSKKRKAHFEAMRHARRREELRTRRRKQLGVEEQDSDLDYPNVKEYVLREMEQQLEGQQDEQEQDEEADGAGRTEA